MAAANVVDVRSYRWERLPDMPTGRVYSVGGYNEGKLYVLGKAISNPNIYKTYIKDFFICTLWVRSTMSTPIMSRINCHGATSLKFKMII